SNPRLWPPAPPRARNSFSVPVDSREAAMEHGSVADSSASTFSIMEEDHTLANSVRFVLNQDPRVAFCGYSIPHPADNKVNIRVQTTGTVLCHMILIFHLLIPVDLTVAFVHALC
uniref:DNA-directed RNA polymerase RBP11-like dimerisation domain-containing protein n=1 Tax=Aegilops tauschii subsp. strangulata TaxID=200361 RepID=A0A453HLC0_AEGTS